VQRKRKVNGFDTARQQASDLALFHCVEFANNPAVRAVSVVFRRHLGVVTRLRLQPRMNATRRKKSPRLYDPLHSRKGEEITDEKGDCWRQDGNRQDGFDGLIRLVPVGLTHQCESVFRYAVRGTLREEPLRSAQTAL
jgi:hypothetical protein